MKKFYPEFRKYVDSLDRIKLALYKSLVLKKFQPSAEKVILKIIIHSVLIRPFIAKNFSRLGRQLEKNACYKGYVLTSDGLKKIRQTFGLKAR